jgi:hypothetical protein
MRMLITGNQKHVAGKTGFLAPVTCHLHAGFEDQTRNAAHLYENIKVFRPFASFQD